MLGSGHQCDGERVPAANAQDDPESPDEEKVLGEGQAVDEPESGEDVANDEDADR